MTTVYWIARSSMRQLVRDRVFSIALLCGLALIAVTVLVSDLTPLTRERTAIDFGLLTLSVFSLAIAVLCGCGILTRDRDLGTVDWFMSRPVRAWQYIAGRYFGLTAIIAGGILTLMPLWILILLWVGEGLTFGLLWAVALTAMKAWVAASIAAFFSVWMSSAPAAVSTTGFLLLSHNSKSFSWATRLVPDLEIFSPGLRPAHSLPLSALVGIGTSAYAILLILFFLMAAILAFRWRDR